MDSARAWLYATLPDWQQDIFDLMANEDITLTVSGEMGRVDATLGINEFKNGKKITNVIAEVVGATDFEEAMTELMKQYQAQNQ